ncbi:MAG: DUF748 domain-containing protein [Ferruginibacter sp.]
MKLLKRILLLLVITFVSVVILLFAFISPITKWAIEKYSVQYTGRQVKMDKLWINLFTGSVSSKNFRIYELNSNKIFFQTNELYAHMILRKVLASEYVLTDIKFTKPQVTFIEKGNRFNFSDLIERFSTKDKAKRASTNAKPLKWYINNFDIDSAVIIYTNTSPYNTIKIQNCTVAIPGIAWNKYTYNINTDFDLASGGNFKMRSSFDKNTLIYKLMLNIKQFNISPWYTYLKDYMRVNSLDGLVSTNLNITGNMHNSTAIAASGNVMVENFSIVDNVNDKLTAIDRMELDIDSVNTEKNIYHFATITLDKPYLKLEMYKDGYNFSRLLTSPAAVDTSSATYSNMFLMMADYIQQIAGNYVASNYNADKFLVQGGQFVFYDYTLYDKFRYNFDSLYLMSDKINSNSSKIYIDASSYLNRSGIMKGKMDINPKDFKDFDIDCSVKNVAVADFNPYTKYYVATPFLNGTGDYTNKTSVVKRQLKSDNLLIVNKIVAGKKDKTNKPQYNMPVRLAVAILRDVHGNIKLDIPVTGSLDDPKFKMGKVIWSVLGNMMVKAATAPFRLLAGVFGGKEDDYKEVDFNYLQTAVTSDQQKQLDKLAKMLKSKPDLKLELIQVVNAEDEAEDLAVYAAKKKYLGISDSATDAQLVQVNSLSTSDTSFAKYIDSVQKNPTTYLSTQEKCVLIIGKPELQKCIDSIMQKRNESVQNYLLRQQVPKQCIYIHNTNKPNDPNLGNYPKLIINVATNNE